MISVLRFHRIVGLLPHDINIDPNSDGLPGIASSAASSAPP